MRTRSLSCPCVQTASTPHRLEAIRTRGLYLRQHLKLASSPQSDGQQVIDHRGALQADEAVAPVLGDPAQHGVPVGLEAAQWREADGEPAVHTAFIVGRPSRPPAPTAVSGDKGRDGEGGLSPLVVCSNSPEHHSTWYRVFSKLGGLGVRSCRTRVPVGRYVEGDLRASECKAG